MHPYTKFQQYSFFVLLILRNATNARQKTKQVSRNEEKIDHTFFNSGNICVCCRQLLTGLLCPGSSGLNDAFLIPVKHVGMMLKALFPCWTRTKIHVASLE